MHHLRSNSFCRVLAFLAVAMLVIPMSSVTAKADTSEPAIKIKHKPIKYFVPEKRIRLETKVTDESGINLVRCYFKGSAEADYLFIPMNPTKDDLYEAVLPAPSKTSLGIQYLFLVVSDQNVVVRTQEYMIPKSDKEKTPAWQMDTSTGEITVSTELAEAPEAVAGFTDSIVIDAVESAARFGFVVEGIYIASQIAAAGGAAGSAAAATGAGTVAASSGVSTAVVVGAAAGVVAAGAAAAGGGGGEEYSIAGRWNYRKVWTRAENRHCYEGGLDPSTGWVEIAVDGNRVTLNFEGDRESGTLSGNILKYSVSSRPRNGSCVFTLTGKRTWVFSENSFEGSGTEKHTAFRDCVCGNNGPSLTGRTFRHEVRYTGNRQ